MVRMIMTADNDGSALQPLPPFPKWTARIRLGLVLLPLLIATFIVPSSIVVHRMTILIGIMFFSQPILSRLAHKLHHNFPNWRRYLALRW